MSGSAVRKRFRSSGFAWAEADALQRNKRKCMQFLGAIMCLKTAFFHFLMLAGKEREDGRRRL